MKKTLFILTMSIGTIFTQAQNKLQYGQSDLKTIISLPYFHYDALRLQQPSWIKEEKGANNTWIPEKKYITNLAEPNLFSLLADSTYNKEKSNWELSNHYAYTYQRNNNLSIASNMERKWIETGSGQI